MKAAKHKPKVRRIRPSVTGLTAADDILMARREWVARFRLRGMTIREIAHALADLDPPIINVESGEAWSHQAINEDLMAMRSEWRANAERDTAEWFTEQLAENAEARRECWDRRDMPTLARFTDQHIKLTGTAAPAKTEDMPTTAWRDLVRKRGGDPDAVKAAVREQVSKRASPTDDGE